MTGIFFIAVVIAWLCAAVWLTGWATSRIERKWVRLSVSGLLFMGLMVLPVADEIIGGVQYRTLCEKNARLDIDREKIKGKSVRVIVDPSGKSLKGAFLPIKFSYFSYRDVVTNEEYANYTIYHVQGGWFIRMLGISEGNAPLTIENTTCRPSGNSKTFALQYNFNLVK